MLLYKTLLTATVAILVSGCDGGHGTTVEHPVPVTAAAIASAAATPDTLPSCLLPAIISCMKAEDGAGCDMCKQVTDSSLELYFYGTIDSTGTDSMVMMYVIMTTNGSRYPVCRGDMNGDGRPDLVVSVHTEGGGGNTWWDEHLLFLDNGNGGYKLADSEPDGAINGCGGGYFSCDTIVHGLLHGTATCYAPGDGHCCPSLEYGVNVKYANGKLVFAGRMR